MWRLYLDWINTQQKLWKMTGSPIARWANSSWILGLPYILFVTNFWQWICDLKSQFHAHIQCTCILGVGVALTVLSICVTFIFACSWVVCTITINNHNDAKLITIHSQRYTTNFRAAPISSVLHAIDELSLMNLNYKIPCICIHA